MFVSASLFSFRGRLKFCKITLEVEVRPSHAREGPDGIHRPELIVMEAGKKSGGNKRPRRRERGKWSEAKWRAKERKKEAREGGREGGTVREREKELCEGTRLKRTERSRAKRSYFT